MWESVEQRPRSWQTQASTSRYSRTLDVSWGLRFRQPLRHSVPHLEGEASLGAGMNGVARRAGVGVGSMTSSGAVGEFL